MILALRLQYYRHKILDPSTLDSDVIYGRALNRDRREPSSTSIPTNSRRRLDKSARYTECMMDLDLALAEKSEKIIVVSLWVPLLKCE